MRRLEMNKASLIASEIHLYQDDQEYMKKRKETIRLCVIQPMEIFWKNVKFQGPRQEIAIKWHDENKWKKMW